jgi:hypothetical protein
MHNRGTNSGDDPEKGGGGGGSSMLSVIVASVLVAVSLVFVLQFGTLLDMTLFTANNDVSSNGLHHLGGMLHRLLPLRLLLLLSGQAHLGGQR